MISTIRDRETDSPHHRDDGRVDLSGNKCQKNVSIPHRAWRPHKNTPRTTRTFAVPYTFNLGSTTPPSSRGSMDTEPTGWYRGPQLFLMYSASAASVALSSGVGATCLRTTSASGAVLYTLSANLTIESRVSRSCGLPK